MQSLPEDLDDLDQQNEAELLILAGHSVIKGAKVEEEIQSQLKEKLPHITSKCDYNVESNAEKETTSVFQGYLNASNLADLD